MDGEKELIAGVFCRAHTGGVRGRGRGGARAEKMEDGMEEGVEEMSKD